MSNNDNDGVGSGERLARRAPIADPAPPETFVRTMQANDLDVAVDLRFEDWSGVAFDGQDLKGCDFTGAVIAGCTFDGAKLCGARFAGVVLGTSPYPSGERKTPSDENVTSVHLVSAWQSQAELAGASDWLEHCAEWSPPVERQSDRHVSPFECMQDAPFSPRLVLLPRDLTRATPRDAKRENKLVWGRDVGFGYQQRFVAPMPVTALQLLPYCRDLPKAERGRFADDMGIWEQMLAAQRVDGLARDIVPLTWDEGDRYLNWLRRKTAQEYRRLSEAEWEFAYARNVISNVAEGECWYEWLDDHWLLQIEASKSDGSPMLRGDPNRRVVRQCVEPRELSPIARRSMRTDAQAVAALRVARLWTR